MRPPNTIPPPSSHPLAALILAAILLTQSCDPGTQAAEAIIARRKSDSIVAAFKKVDASLDSACKALKPQLDSIDRQLDSLKKELQKTDSQ